MTPVGSRIGFVRRRILWSLGGVVVMFCASFLSLFVIARPNPTRAEQEQKAVFSSYLFEYPLIARPLPTLCRYLQERDNLGTPAKLVVSNRTFTRLPALLVVADLPEQQFHANGVPFSTFRDFIAQNLSPENISSIFAPSNVQVAFLPKSLHSNEDDAVSVTFSRAGFDREFSWAMFYSELSCGTESGKEYVYLTRDWKHGQKWYVAGVDRLSGSKTTKRVPNGEN